MEIIEVFLNQVQKLALDMPASISDKQFFHSCLVFVLIDSILYYLQNIG